MLEQAAEQKAADLLHRMLRGESDGCNEMVLLAATLDLAQEVLSHDHKKRRKNSRNPSVPPWAKQWLLQVSVWSRVPDLHSVVLSVVVGDGLQERLCVVAQGDSARVEFGFVWRCGAQRAAVVLVLLLVVVVVDLTGLQAPREDGGLEPFCAGTDTKHRKLEQGCMV